MRKRFGIALLFYSNCIFAMNQVELANAVAVKYSRDLEIVSYNVPRRYESIVKGIGGADIENGWGLKIWDNVERVLSELIISGVSKFIRYLDISYGMTSSVFRRLTDFNCVEYLLLRKCFLASSDLSFVPPCVKFLDLSLLKSLKYLDLSCSNFTAAIYKMKFPNTKLNIIDDRDAADVYGGDVS